MNEARFSRYEIRGTLGKGGMAEVYRAYDPYSDREVALKILRREMYEDQRVRERFERETKIIASLELEGVVPVYDFGNTAEGQLFYVLRLMTGGSLADRLQHGPMPPAEIDRILKRIAPAIDHAHEKGIIHRDLKPANILFDERNNAFVSDFGIAKFTSSFGAHTLTDSNGIVGTPKYMSPEQAQGDQVDARSDVYSLGVVVLEMLLGKESFDKSISPFGMAFVYDPGAVDRVYDSIPNLTPGLRAVLKKVLARDRDQRYDSCVEFANALSDALSGSAPEYPTEPRPKLVSRPGVWVAGVILFFVLAVFTLWRYPQFFHPATGTAVGPGVTSTPTATATVTETPSPTPTATVTPTHAASPTPILVPSPTNSETGWTTGHAVIVGGSIITTVLVIGLLGLVVYTSWRTSSTNKGRHTSPRIKKYPRALPAPESSATITIDNLLAVIEPDMRGEIMVGLIGRDIERRLSNKIAHLRGAGRFLFHGFGHFGASALIDQIVQIAEFEYKNLTQIREDGIIMTIRIDATTLDEKEGEINAVIREFKYGARQSNYAWSFQTQIERLKKMSLPEVKQSPDESSILVKVPFPGIEVQFSKKFGTANRKATGDDLLKLLADFLDRAEKRQPNSPDLLIDRILGTTTLPHRIVFVIDHIKSEKIFGILRQMRLFDDKRITFFGIVKQEVYLSWKEDEEIMSMIDELNFESHYVSCLWEEDAGLIDSLIQYAFGYRDTSNQQLLQDFKDHIAYVSRGAPADAVRETLRSEYCDFPKGVPTLILDKIADIGELRAHASLQRLLVKNWTSILGPRFDTAPQEEKDQARCAIYKLLEWMNKRLLFTRSEIREYSVSVRLRIMQTDRLTLRILDSLLDTLVKENYLERSKNTYRVIHRTLREDIEARQVKRSGGNQLPSGSRG